jgi:hypothetical protein
MDTRWRGSPVNQDTLGRAGLAAEMLGQFLTYTGHQLRFSETTVNDLQFIGRECGPILGMACGISTHAVPRQALHEVATSIFL